MAAWLRVDAGEALPDPLIMQIYQRTGGLPLLVEEFTRMVRESAGERSVSARLAA